MAPKRQVFKRPRGDIPPPNRAVEIRITLTLLLVLIRAQTISGQGAVNGVVRDDPPSPVAKIILTEESKGLVRESESSRDGSFLFPSLIAGIYSVSVQKEGFSTEQMNALRIEVGELASINFATDATANSPATFESPQGMPTEMFHSRDLLLALFFFVQAGRNLQPLTLPGD